jgi:hypothetical protein
VRGGRGRGEVEVFAHTPCTHISTRRHQCMLFALNRSLRRWPDGQRQDLHHGLHIRARVDRPFRGCGCIARQGANGFRVVRRACGRKVCRHAQQGYTSSAADRAGWRRSSLPPCRGDSAECRGACVLHQTGVCGTGHRGHRRAQSVIAQPRGVPHLHRPWRRPRGLLAAHRPGGQRASHRFRRARRRPPQGGRANQ